MSKHCRSMENIRKVLEDHKHRRVTLILVEGRRLENVKIKKVCRNVVLVKCHDTCMYVKICCICVVIPKCYCCECDEHHHHHEDCKDPC